MRRYAGGGAVLGGVLCVVLTACFTLTDPRIGGEQEASASTLTLETDGPGAIALDALGVTCTSVCDVPVEPGSSLSLRAVPSGNQPFAGWEGPCSGAGSCSIQVADDMKVRAVFANYFLNVDVQGGGTVFVFPPGVDCSAKCIVRFEEPIEVRVEKKTEETEIQDWGGLCEDAVNSVCVVNVDGKTDVEVETETEVTVPPQNPPGNDPPPEDDPPAQDPPDQDPPDQDPPDQDPPDQDPPAEDPPSDEPPTEDPPEEPPDFEPPFDPPIGPIGDDPPLAPPGDEPIAPPDGPISDPPLDDPALDPINPLD